MSKLEVNLDLVRKYNVPGPRYTSYPPATQFTDGLTWPQLAGALLENNRGAERPLSLYFHIPFCESLCWYCGCNTVITTRHAQAAAYLDYLEKEMEAMRAILHPGRKVVQIHLGGGTPTFLSPDEIRRLGEMIRSRFPIAPEVEAGVEIDPRRLTHGHIAALREAGFNRASLGVQDFDPRVQLAVRRIQSREQTQQAMEWLREHGFESINMDVIYGLPLQSLASFERTLEAVLAFQPDRLAAFSYAHVPWIKPAQKRLEKDLPSVEEKLELLKLVVETMTDQGRFVYIGMDHFARPGDELAIAQRQGTLHRNFQGYSTRGGTDIYSFGMSSISQIDSLYWQNQKELPRYYEALDEGRSPLARGYLLSAEDQLRRATIMRLMCEGSLDYGAMSRQLGIDFSAHFERELASLEDFEADGLIRQTPLGVEVTDTGRLLIRNIAMRFDACLPKLAERRFSRTI